VDDGGLRLGEMKRAQNIPGGIVPTTIDSKIYNLFI
jgi:hypothetical protein